MILRKDKKLVRSESDVGQPKLEELSVELEATLTQSSFGYEYALLNLKGKEIPFNHRQALLDQLEQHKTAYFQARAMLHQLDPEKLNSIERELIRQKESILRSASPEHRFCLH